MEQAIGTGEWLRMMGSLVLVLCLVVASLWCWRWLQRRQLGGRGHQHAQLRVEEVVQLSVRHKVVLLRAGSRQVLVGVSPSGMSALAQWPRFDDELKQAQAHASGDDHDA